VAIEQAIITHRAEMSVAGSVAIATATAMCLNASKETSGPHELGWWGWLARFIGRYSNAFGQDVEDLATLVFKGRKGAGWKPGEGEEYEAVLALVLKEDDPHWDGISPWARTSVLWSLYCLMAHPRNIWKAVELSIMPGGDVDTTAAMAGALVGAHVGIDAFPEQVIEKVAPWVHDVRSPEWDWVRLEKLAEQLHVVAVTRHEGHGTEEIVPVLSMFGIEDE
jgi:ADP-ribosylglycohydrolase